MSDLESLQAEVEKLRGEVEEYRQRELAGLRDRLSKAEQAAEHYRGEAHRNATVGQQIATEAEQQLADLRSRLDRATNITGQNLRANANPGRN